MIEREKRASAIEARKKLEGVATILKIEFEIILSEEIRLLAHFSTQTNVSYET